MAEGTAESQNAILPEDLIIEILSRVEPSVYLQLRCVCKWWKSLVFDRYLLEKHIRISITEIMYLVCDAVKRLKSSELLRKEEDLDGEEEEEEDEEDFDDDDEEDFDEEEEDDEENFDEEEEEVDDEEDFDEEEDDDYDDEDEEEDFDEDENDDEEENNAEEEEDEEDDDEEDFDEEENNAEEENVDEDNGGGSEEEEKESAWKVVIEFLRQKEAVPLDNFLKILRGIKEQYESIRDEMQIAEDRVKCLQNILQVRLSQVMNE